ncbi:ABC transporter ATP-binding protein [Catellatospora methionotrophica]|uniref:ABC transporter ATP-binding protein n=1 Tax=Catellatospora methionotrophica TaxID=121620 RepID=UPI0033DB2F73
MSDVILQVRDLQTHYLLRDGVTRAVDGVSFDVRRGRTLCVVGESGCGKSATAHSILQLVDEPGKIVGGRILLHRTHGEQAGQVVDLAALRARGRQMREIRGREIAMVFQEPMTSLSPVHTVGDQVMEAIRLHLPLPEKQIFERAVDLLDRVRIPNPRRHMDSYTFQLSGGMRQRVSLAAALSCEPALLIADEPTTALDVTTQAQILDLFAELQQELDMAVMFITHDLGVVASIADEVVVMYLGQVAEQTDVDSLFHRPAHPYTRALLSSVPKPGTRTRLAPIRGGVPSPYDRPTGCAFHPRCDAMMPGVCDRAPVPLVDLDAGRAARCMLYTEEVARDGEPVR